jgi:hypothetical protein
MMQSLEDRIDVLEHISGCLVELLDYTRVNGHPELAGLLSDVIDEFILETDKLQKWQDYEDDGQPDEAQEWHDYDPDC